jgi:hypothetical protein
MLIQTPNECLTRPLNSLPTVAGRSQARAVYGGVITHSEAPNIKDIQVMATIVRDNGSWVPDPSGATEDRNYNRAFRSKV